MSVFDETFEVTQRTYLDVFAVLSVDEDGGAREWRNLLVTEKQAETLKKRAAERGDDVYFVPIRVWLPRPWGYMIPSRLAGECEVEFKHATISVFEPDCGEDRNTFAETANRMFGKLDP